MAAKQGIMERRLRVNKILPFFTQKFEGQEYATLERFSYLVSPAGLPEACEHIAGGDSAKFSEHVLRFAKKKLSEFAVETGLRFALGYVRDPQALKRFSSINQRFGQKEEYSDSLAKDASTEALLQQYCNGGSFLVSGADSKDARYVTVLEKQTQ
jgi:anaerobic ribonucleoside-triphosphate reductase